MSLHLDTNASILLFNACGKGYVEVRGQRYRANVLVEPERLVEGWCDQRYDTLTSADLERLIELTDAGIVLLGTGEHFCKPPTPALLQPIIAARVGLEVMDNPAVCRTYNILALEGRKVAAALLFE